MPPLRQSAARAAKELHLDWHTAEALEKRLQAPLERAGQPASVGETLVRSFLGGKDLKKEDER